MIRPGLRKTRFGHGVLLFATLLTVVLGSRENQTQSVLDGVTFDSDRDNGSMGEVSQGTEPDTFLVRLYEEDGELGTRRYWFRFQVSGPAGRVITLDLDHSENPRPFIRETGTPWRRMTADEAPDLQTLVLQLQGTDRPIELAFFEPLGLEETKAQVDEITAGFPQMVTHEFLGQSEEGRALTLVTVTDPDTPIGTKKRVWVHSRAHAGEVTSTHSLLGLLEQLLEDSPLGSDLRSQLIVHFVPLLNPDGVHRGYTRWDALGRDPESQWCAIESPAVQAIKTKVDALMNEDIPISLSLNLHSTKGIYADSFFFKHLAPSVSPVFEQIQQRYIDALAANTPLFEDRSPGSSQLHACRFIESYFWNGWGEDVMALTHEGHFHRRLTDGDWITGQDYREIGRGMARALVDYYDLQTTPTKSWESWLTEHFDSVERRFASLSGPMADPDNDGLANLLEYGQATDPREANPIRPALELSEFLTFTRSTGAIDVTWAIEQSADLISWQTLPHTAWEIQPSELPGLESVTAARPQEADSTFLRLKVLLNNDR